MELNDELLSAYLDNALDGAEHEAVAAALATDAGARLRLERMRQADRALRTALPTPQGDKFEAALAARIQMGRPVSRWQRTVLPWALAASVAGLVAGYMLPRAQSPMGLSTPDRQLARALDDTRSGGASAAQGVSMVLSFQAADGRYCRLFRASRDAVSGEGLACRGSAGWKVVAWDSTTTTSTEGFRAAGAGMLIDGAMSELGGSPAMDAGEEGAAITRGWSKP
jgi:hypothetical protein